jgi:glycosyltransferase involved in cell wall biosynthesis
LSNVKSGFFAKTTFLYPALPRVFKNFEVIAEAAKLLFEQGTSNFDVLLTISGDENKFARYIIKKYKDIPTISFIGLKTRDEIFALYRQVDALIFSSKLETWGLPITEAKQFDKPMILSDLPYARETVGSYDKVKFFQPDDCFQLADFMKSFIDKSLVYDGNKSFRVQRPFAENWKELFEILLGSRE